MFNALIVEPPIFCAFFHSEIVLFIRYWNDKEVLQKLGEAMGMAVGGERGESATSAGDTAEDETEELNDEESIVHHTASVGDVEVCV